jgi:hypothetical protein
MGLDHLMVASSSLLSTLTWTLIPLSGNLGLVPGSTERKDVIEGANALGDRSKGTSRTGGSVRTRRPSPLRR